MKVDHFEVYVSPAGIRVCDNVSPAPAPFDVYFRWEGDETAGEGCTCEGHGEDGAEAARIRNIKRRKA